MIRAEYDKLRKAVHDASDAREVALERCSSPVMRVAEADHVVVVNKAGKELDPAVSLELREIQVSTFSFTHIELPLW